MVIFESLSFTGEKLRCGLLMTIISRLVNARKRTNRSRKAMN